MDLITTKSIGIDGMVFAERRSDMRRRVLKGALISFNQGYSTFECIVRSISDDGARLSFGETFSLPNQFLLTISGEAPRQAVVRWRTQSTVGVSLV